MGCTASRHLDKYASMEGCPSPPATESPQCASTYATDYSVEYHHHFVALTSSSYGLLKVDPPSKPPEPNKYDKSRISSLNEMYGKLRSLELAETANILPWPCDAFKSPSGGDVSCPPSVHHEWRIDSTEFVISETINVRELMMGFEEEALPQGIPHGGQACSIVVSPAPRGPLASRQCKKKPFHTVEEVDVLRRSGKVIQNGLDEEEYESGKENSLPEQGQHIMLAPPTRCPLGNTALSQIPQSPLKLKEARERGIPSIIKSSSKISTSPSTSRVTKNMASKHGKAEPALRKKQHQKRPAASFAPLSVSSMTSMSKRVVVRESILSTDPSSPLFDPDMVASYEKALKTISEDSWNACLVSPEVHRQCTPASIHKVQNDALQGFGNLEPLKDVEQKTYNALDCFEEKCPPGGDMTVVLYTTTLRGIRKTFEDCNILRSILQSYSLSIDERDVSMHLEFLNELRGLMDRVVSVPRLFIKGRYIGGIEEVAKLHENGKLNELVEGLPREANGGNCDGCGGIRFVPCLECRGSCKVRFEGNKVQRCPDCNENGLIQCPICT